MGWKAACVLISPTGGAFLRDRPSHDELRAVELLQRLALNRYVPSRMTTFDEAVYPGEDQLFVGAYTTGALLCSWSLARAVIVTRNARIIDPILREAGNGYVLGLALQSVTDYWAYAYYESGRLVRARGGSGDDGIFVDTGSPLVEERDLLMQAEEHEGAKVFRSDFGGASEYVSVDNYGEEFTFEVSRKAFGARMDEMEPDALALQLFTPKRSLIQRVLGR